MPGFGKVGNVADLGFELVHGFGCGHGGCGTRRQAVMRKPVVRPVGGTGSTARIVDAGPGRPLRERPFDARHGLDLALDLRLDPAVRHVADEPGHALADRGVLDEVAEADALDAAADEITTGDDHESGAPVRLEPARRTRMVCEGLDDRNRGNGRGRARRPAHRRTRATRRDARGGCSATRPGARSAAGPVAPTACAPGPPSTGRRRRPWCGSPRR